MAKSSSVSVQLRLCVFSWAVAVNMADMPLKMHIRVYGEPVQQTRAHTLEPGPSYVQPVDF